jgi:hypothetical protein
MIGFNANHCSLDNTSRLDLELSGAWFSAGANEAAANLGLEKLPSIALVSKQC